MASEAREPRGSEGSSDPGLDGTELEAVGRACFALHARMTARILSRTYDAAMRKAGLRVAQFGILGAVGYDSNITETALAERLGLERTTLIRNLKLLAEKGWIEPVPGEGRGIRHRLTPAGRRAFEAALPLWKDVQSKVEARLAGTDADATRQAMRALRRAGR